MSHSAHGTKAVIYALIGNFLLTVIKVIAYLLSGSGAMLAEAIHSAADLGNQALLFIGIKKSEAAPSALHPFGYGKDRFLFAFLSAAGIFFLGAGVTITHGIHDLLDPGHKGEAGLVVAVVLGVSLLVDGAVLITAFKAVNKARAGQPWLQYLRTAEDTTTLAVMFEDGAASLGVLTAGAGIAASHFLGWVWADSVAAILIGVLLGAVAIYLGIQNRSYLLDRAVNIEVQARLLSAIQNTGNVTQIAQIKTRVLGADRFAVSAEIDLDGQRISERLQEGMKLDDELAKLKTVDDLDRLLDLYAVRVVDALGEEINRIEAEIQAQVPAAHFIQLEID